jgi:hypothetical protein
MTVDATSILIQKILSQLSQVEVASQTLSANIAGQADSVVGAVANYAQILGTAEGPVAQAAAIAAVGGSEAAAGAQQAAYIAAQATSAGIGAGIVLIVAFIFGELFSSDSGSSDAAQLTQIQNEIKNLEDTDLAKYWTDKLGLIMSVWNAKGGLGDDLDDLASQGITGNYVKADAKTYHSNAQAFVNNLIPSKNPAAGVFWERPILQDELFTVQIMKNWGPYPFVQLGQNWSNQMGWYGKQPLPQTGAPLGAGQQQMAADPNSSLAFLLLGIKAYLSLQALVHFIDPSQPELVDKAGTGFLQQYGGDLEDYGSFLYSQYTLAVNGIVKSALPEDADIRGFLQYEAVQIYSGDFSSKGSFDWEVSPTAADVKDYMATQLVASENHLILPTPSPLYLGTEPWAPTSGFQWNGVYGTVNVYPRYGGYVPSLPAAVP